MVKRSFLEELKSNYLWREKVLTELELNKSNARQVKKHFFSNKGQFANKAKNRIRGLDTLLLGEVTRLREAPVETS